MKTKTLLLLSFLAFFGASCNSLSSEKYKDDDFTHIFNGENLDGWYLKIRSGDEELAKKIFAVEESMIHIFNDEFPNPYNLGQTDTHGLMYTNKSYSKFILRFEYKWGETIANNYDRFQYDAGCYYHVTNDKIWPTGVEYQVRYDDINDINYTGDFYIDKKARDFFRYTNGEGYYLSKANGGVATPRPKDDAYQQKATKGVKANGLNGEWNECEIIVMEDKYAIHKLNGEVVNVAENILQTGGVIGFQSETGEIYYRNIRILEFDEVVPMEEFIK
ncbi:MAG: DUF1080 domain-containing protein [Rikenellaceae bacterium]